MCVHGSGREWLGSEFKGDWPLSLRNRQGVNCQRKRYIWTDWVSYAGMSNSCGFWTFVSGPGILKSAVCRSLYCVMRLTFKLYYSLSGKLYAIGQVVLQPEQVTVAYTNFFSKMSRSFYIRSNLTSAGINEAKFQIWQTGSSNIAFLVIRSQKNICYFKLSSDVLHSNGEIPALN